MVGVVDMSRKKKKRQYHIRAQTTNSNGQRRTRPNELSENYYGKAIARNILVHHLHTDFVSRAGMNERELRKIIFRKLVKKS